LLFLPQQIQLENNSTHHKRVNAMNIGDKVRRNTAERGYQGIGYIVEIDNVCNRARIQWETNKTWYNMARLLLIGETETDSSLLQQER
jgi:hypothetical protein